MRRGFAAELRRLGYTASPTKKHLYLLAHLSGWLDAQGVDIGELASARVDPFFAARRAAGVANLRTRASLAPLLAYLGSSLFHVGSARLSLPTVR